MHGKSTLIVGLIVAFAHARPHGDDRCVGVGRLVGFDIMSGGLLVMDSDGVMHGVDPSNGDDIGQADPRQAAAFILARAESEIDGEYFEPGVFHKMITEAVESRSNAVNKVEADACEAATVGDIRADTARIHANLVEGAVRREGMHPIGHLVPINEWEKAPIVGLHMTPFGLGISMAPGALGNLDSRATYRLVRE